MTIEFRCQQCQYLLRTQDDAIGKQARCPQCGHTQVVAAEPISAETAQPASPFSSVGAAAPAPSVNHNPFAEDPTPNPYAATLTPPNVPDDSVIQSRLAVPAVLLIVMSALSSLMSGFIVMAGLIVAMTEGMDSEDAGMLLLFGTSLTMSILAIVGGVQMYRCRSYRLAMLSAIVTVAPVYCLWCLGLPFGIWAIVVLLEPQVKRLFR